MTRLNVGSTTSRTRSSNPTYFLTHFERLKELLRLNLLLEFTEALFDFVDFSHQLKVIQDFLFGHLLCLHKKREKGGLGTGDFTDSVSTHCIVDPSSRDGNASQVLDRILIFLSCDVPSYE